MGAFRPVISLLVLVAVTSEYSPACAQTAPAPSQVMPPVIEPYSAPTRIEGPAPHRFEATGHRQAIKHKRKRRSGTSAP